MSGSIRAEARDVWGEAHAMADWLQEHPGATVVLACSPFGSGRLRYVFDKVLGPADAARVRLTLLPDPGCRIGKLVAQPQRREGVHVCLAGIDLCLGGRGRRPPAARWGLPRFKQEIRAQIGEAPP